MGSAQSELQAPIRDGDLEATMNVLDSYGHATPLLIRKQFNVYDGEMFVLQPVYVTPSHYAIMCGRSEILRLLIEKGADANEQGPGSTTLLHHAAKKMDANCVAVLLEHGADVQARDEKQRTALHYLAAASGRNARPHQAALDTVNLLLRYGNAGDVNLFDCQYRTALHHAALRGCTQLVAHLLRNGANTQALDSSQLTAYMLAKQYPDLQKMLLLQPAATGDDIAEESTAGDKAAAGTDPPRV